MFKLSPCFNPLKRVFFSATRAELDGFLANPTFQSAKARLLLCDAGMIVYINVTGTFQSAKARLLLCDSGLSKPLNAKLKDPDLANPYFRFLPQPKHTTNSSLPANEK